MGLDLEKLMGCSKAAMIYDSNEFWKWDGHSAVFGCYASTKHSLRKATHCAVRISLDQGSSFVLESFVVQHLTAVEQTWSAAAFLLPSNSAPVWDPAASPASFWKPHKREGKFFTAPHRLLKNPVWFSSLEIYPWAHQPLCALWIQPCPGECGRNNLGPYSVSQPAQLAWADLHRTDL